MSKTAPLKFSWYELMAKDVPKTLAFYRDVFGWTTKDAQMSAEYTLIEVQGQAIGGAMTLTDEMSAAGAIAGWLGYIGTPDLASTTEAFVAAGGKVLRPMVEIPGVIRFTIVADPGGAVFAMFQGLSEDGAMPSFPQGTLGAVDWHELHATDGAAAWAFYSQVFGWHKDKAVDMGPMGTYQTFNVGGHAVGGMMTKMPQTPGTFWLFYVAVDGVEAAIERVKAGGGTVIHGPTQVPDGSTIANCVDPGGAVFAMVAQPK